MGSFISFMMKLKQNLTDLMILKKAKPAQNLRHLVFNINRKSAFYRAMCIPGNVFNKIIIIY